MKLSKIPVPNETCLVEIVSDDNTLNHCVYFLNMEPNVIPYDCIFAWQMDSEMVAIIRHFGKIKNVLNFLETDEFREEAHILDDFISARPTPIEKESEEVHRRGVVARNKMLNIIEKWVL